MNENVDCVVLEWADVDKYLTPAQVETLMFIIEDIDTGKKDDGRNRDTDYAVVRDDSPIYGDVLDLIHEDDDEEEI